MASLESKPAENVKLKTHKNGVITRSNYDCHIKLLFFKNVVEKAPKKVLQDFM